jgi:hypothetical protein
MILRSVGSGAAVGCAAAGNRGVGAVVVMAVAGVLGVVAADA